MQIIAVQTQLPHAQTQRLHSTWVSAPSSNVSSSRAHSAERQRNPPADNSWVITRRQLTEDKVQECWMVLLTQLENQMHLITFSFAIKRQQNLSRNDECKTRQSLTSYLIWKFYVKSIINIHYLTIIFWKTQWISLESVLLYRFLR